MKQLLLVLCLVAGVFAREIPEVTFDPLSVTAYDYHNRYGIPMGKKILEAEEEIMKDPSRIVGGSSAELYEFPYQAGLIMEFLNTTGRGICGASLVSNNRLITAAHCWYDGTNQAFRVTVVLGAFFLFFGGTRIVSENVIMHETWNPSAIRDDVAVIYLPEPVTFSHMISPIALPSNEDLDESFAGYYGTATGFGRTDTGVIENNQHISKVTVPVITNSVCWFGFPGVVQSSNICTSAAGGKGTCQGDSGGPLVVEKDGRTILVGVTSFGSAFGCTIGLPAVFARITSFMSFFQRHIA